MNLSEMVRAGLDGRSATPQQALEVLRSPDEMTMSIVAAAGRLRRHFFANRVRLNYLVNLKSGLCPEDCSYCSQRLGSRADIMKYSWADPEVVRDAVEAGISGGARRVCLVASGHGPSRRDVDRVGETVAALKTEHPGVEVCVCLGFVDDEKAEVLHRAGADAYNHNANTARSHYGEICSTHSYQDRMDTLDVLKRNGLSPCSGVIAGMGESDEELVEVITDLRRRGVDSVPVNFLLPFDGTPLAGRGQELTPLRCLKILAMVRFIHPDAEVRAAAGREMHLRTLQPLALEIANSIFLGDYLTSEGAAGAKDLQMIRDAGFVLEGSEQHGGQEPEGEPGAGSGTVPIRHRGVGSRLPANA
ncbi:MAG: biotin synthase BioB [Acidipropionibacterium acidipropionici]|jgi:biotin synthase|uniref:Biotin synthase n=3 Tax=Acidipropionibacterium acidipropionici TaxID=1748 RepID=A0A142KKE5_9ACTN|nr:biotin synthase BioB [Acidipropionibacterium acidipropionici]AFV88851.1 Biotin synthase [Acidipropionibacterium acidipropionici ATCC 4875]ALN16544.1 biotin synthase [Acidipropionibacterium acidipropionici]AMS06583.1 biotin synthase [Acidipropionibacterium acidipropionici]AOZ45370.1 biotin synthase BioB [Acidipropionibacterium acidipropionici]APZ10403.1 biotin synthase BioB [Acidipropionibacterium acidipropionici]